MTEFVFNPDTRRIRTGKTAREHADGRWANRFSNRAERVSWQKERNRNNTNFPLHVCNGKRSQALKKRRSK